MINKILNYLKIPYKNHSNRLLSYMNTVLFITNEDTLSDLQKRQAVTKIMKALSLNIQNFILEQLISSKHQYFYDDVFQNHFLFCPKCYEKVGQTISTEFDIPKKISLNCTPIFSPLWNYKRMINVFSNIGEELENPFEYHKLNHYAYLIYPLGLYIAHNGLHSITTGILDNNGYIFPDFYDDISSWYPDITFNGTVFKHNKCNATLFNPPCKDVGIIFEIGRILLDSHLGLPYPL